MEETTRTFTISLLGSPGAGKSAIIRRFVQGKYTNFYIPIKCKPDKIDLKIDGKTCTLIIRDEQRDIPFLNPAVHVTRNDGPYIGNDGIIICFDITSKDTFNDAKLVLDCSRNHSPKAHILLAATKHDLQDKRTVSEDEANAFAKEEGLELIEVSAKENLKVTFLFEKLAQDLLGNIPKVSRGAKK